MQAQRTAPRRSMPGGSRGIDTYIEAVAAMYCGTTCPEAHRAADAMLGNRDDVEDVVAQVKALYGREGVCNYVLALLVKKLSASILEELVAPGREPVVDDGLLKKALEKTLQELDRALSRDGDSRSILQEIAEALRDDCTLPILCLGILLSINPDDVAVDDAARKRYEALLEKTARRIDLCAVKPHGA